jgi:alpha/beta superfamily hydrolase
MAGSGPIDMNETTGPNAQMFFQIAEYLSERGFAVLRYDKRGIGAAAGGFTVSDSNIWGNATF